MCRFYLPKKTDAVYLARVVVGMYAQPTPFPSLSRSPFLLLALSLFLPRSRIARHRHQTKPTAIRRKKWPRSAPHRPRHRKTLFRTKDPHPGGYPWTEFHTPNLRTSPKNGGNLFENSDLRLQCVVCTYSMPLSLYLSSDATWILRSFAFPPLSPSFFLSLPSSIRRRLRVSSRSIFCGRALTPSPTNDRAGKQAGMGPGRPEQPGGGPSSSSSSILSGKAYRGWASALFLSCLSPFPPPSLGAMDETWRNPGRTLFPHHEVPPSHPRFTRANLVVGKKL